MDLIKRNLYRMLKKIAIRDKFSIQQYLRRIKIKKRLILSFLMISLLPISIIGLYSSVNAYISMEKKVTRYSLDVTSHIANNINYIFDNYLDIFNQIALDETLTQDLVEYESNVHRQAEIENRIWLTTASIVGYDSGIDTIEICSNYGHRFYYSAPISRGAISQSKLISEALKQDDIIWNVSKKEVPGDEETYIILAKRMVESSNLKKTVGSTLMSVNREYIDKICQYNAEKSSSYIVLTDAKGTVISNSNKEKNINYLDNNILGTINKLESSRVKGKNLTANERSFKTITDDGIFIVSYDVLSANNWRVINIIPYSYLMQNTVRHVEVTAAIALVYIIFSIYFSSIVTKSIFSPIKNLLNGMYKVGKKDLNVTIVDECESARDEYSVLISGFNKMILRLQNLVNDVYKSKLKKKELEFSKKIAELNALQKQINPHFLYNTLESIYWSTQLKGDEEISEMLTALCKFFRASISKGLEYITIAEEIENTKNYIYLQKIRYGERINVFWNIDEEVMTHKIIKLILQPIVENSFVHGIENMESDGRILINIRKEKDTIVFEVTDNGIGISGKDLNNLQNRINDFDDVSGQFISVKNVHQRIKLYFGDKYGVNIDSELGVGTVVKMSVPII